MKKARCNDKEDCVHYHACLELASKQQRQKRGSVPGGGVSVCIAGCELYQAAPKQFVQTLRSNLGWSLTNNL